MKWKLQEFGADEKCNHCKSKAKNSLLARWPAGGLRDLGSSAKEEEDLPGLEAILGEGGLSNSNFPHSVSD
jgi:hypothetical protein